MQEYLKQLSNSESNKEKHEIGAILNAMQKKSQKIAEPSSVFDKRKKNLIDIYYFYSKLIYSGKDFGRIEYNSSTLSMGKFIIFCRQFGIIEQRLPRNKRAISEQNHKWWLSQEYQQQREQYLNQVKKDQQKGYKRLKLQELVDIFKKHSSNFKEINYWEFEKLVVDLGKSMFDGDYEKFVVKILKLDNDQFKDYLKTLNEAFNCREQDKFRELPGYEKYLYKYPEVDIQQKIYSKLQVLKMCKNTRELKRPRMNTSQSISSIKPFKYEQTSKSKALPKIINPSNAKKNVYMDWEKLDSMDFNDVLNRKEDKFVPFDLIENDDYEDTHFLKEFDLSRETASSQQAKLIQLQNYGTSVSQQRIPHLVYKHDANSIGISIFPQSRSVRDEYSTQKSSRRSIKLYSVIHNK